MPTTSIQTDIQTDTLITILCTPPVDEVIMWMMEMCSLLSVVAHGGLLMIAEVHSQWELLVVLYFTPLKASGMHQA